MGKEDSEGSRDSLAFHWAQPPPDTGCFHGSGGCDRLRGILWPRLSPKGRVLQVSGDPHGSSCSLPTVTCIPQCQRLHPDVPGHPLAQPPSPSHPVSQHVLHCSEGDKEGTSASSFFHRYVFLPALSPSSWITAVITLHLRRGALCQDPGRGKNQSQNSFLSASTWPSPALGLVTKSLKKKKSFFSQTIIPNPKQQPQPT